MERFRTEQNVLEIQFEFFFDTHCDHRSLVSLSNHERRYLQAHPSTGSGTDGKAKSRQQQKKRGAVKLSFGGNPLGCTRL